MENCSPLTSMRAASCNGASGAANSGPSVLLGRSRVTLSRLWCYAGIRQVLPGAQSRRCPEAHHEANRCNLGHVTPKTLQKTLYVGFFQIGRPLQVVCLGRSQFPIPEVRLAGQAGPIYGLTTCGCGEVHRLADRLLLILLGSAHGVVNEVSVSQQLARRDLHFLHAGNNPERANAAQAPAPLGTNLRLTPFQSRHSNRWFQCSVWPANSGCPTLDLRRWTLDVPAPWRLLHLGTFGLNPCYASRVSHHGSTPPPPNPPPTPPPPPKPPMPPPTPPRGMSDSGLPA